MGVFFVSSPGLLALEVRPGMVHPVADAPPPVAAEYLASDRGPVIGVDTEVDQCARERQIVTVVFNTNARYRFYVHTEREAARGFAVLVNYVARHDYLGYIVFFRIGYGGVNRSLADLKRAVAELARTRNPAPSSETADTARLRMGDATAYYAVADEALNRGLSVGEFKEALEDKLAAKAAARETTARATAAPRLKWPADALPDENPAAFAWRAYEAEAEAGTLHMGVIRQDDKKNGTELAVKLVSWLRSPAQRAEAEAAGIDIPTLPEWNTRGIDAGKAKEASTTRPRTEGQRLYEALRRRRRNPATGSAAALV